MSELLEFLQAWPAHPETGIKTAAVVGMAPTSAHLAPWDDPGVCLSILNEMAHKHHRGPDKTSLVKRYDVCWQLHPKWDALRTPEANFNGENHVSWLLNVPSAPCLHCANGSEKKKAECPECDGTGTYRPNRDETKPVVVLFPDMQQVVPGSLLYPYQDIVDFYELKPEEEWFGSTLDYILPMLAMAGFKEIRPFGFEMVSGTEYAQQKASAAWWNGLLRALGVKIVLPEGSLLLRGNWPRYALDKIPGVYTDMHAEIAKTQWKSEVDKQIGELNNIRGQKKQIVAAWQADGQLAEGKPAFAAAMAKITQDEIRQINKLNGTFGSYQQADRVYRELKAQFGDEPLRIFQLNDMDLKPFDVATGEEVIETPRSEEQDSAGMIPLPEIPVVEPRKSKHPGSKRKKRR